jgi:Gametolysin peptidase M11
VHELGHTYGLAHAGASECPLCPILEQGDPFSPMGSGFVDFSAYEKHLLGWTGTRRSSHTTAATHSPGQIAAAHFPTR